MAGTGAVACAHTHLLRPQREPKPREVPKSRFGPNLDSRREVFERAQLTPQSFPAPPAVRIPRGIGGPGRDNIFTKKSRSIFEILLFF